MNDEIADRARRFDMDQGGRFEFFCECGELSCDGLVKLTLAEYDATEAGSVRAH